MELLDRFVAEEIQRETQRLESLVDESMAPMREKLEKRFGAISAANPQGGLNAQTQAALSTFKNSMLAAMQEQIKSDVEARVTSELQTMLKGKVKP